MPATPLSPVGPIVAPAADDRLITVSVAADGELLALWCADADWAALYYHDPPLRTDIPRDKALRQVDLRVSVHRPAGTDVWTVPSPPFPSPTVQLLPDDRILLASSRCAWRPGAGADRNAIIYRRNGTVESESTFGNGFTHLLADLDGAVWAGYGAPGIFGDNGWGPPLGPPPVGSPGLVRFSPADMRPAWAYPADTAWGPVVSCDALNVDDYAVWVCYSHGSPSIRIAQGEVTGWHTNNLRGVRALAVNEPAIGLFGGHDTDANRLVLGSLCDGQVQISGQYRVVMPDGNPADHIRMHGRGSVLHTVIDGAWYQLALDHLSASAQ